MTFGVGVFDHSSVAGPLMTYRADTFGAEQVSNPCDADYLMWDRGHNVAGYFRRSPTDDGTHPGYYAGGSFATPANLHAYAQSSGKGIKWAYQSDWDAIDSADCPTTSGRSVPTWPYDDNAVIVVKYKDNKWGYFRAKSASSRGLAGSWFTGSEADALAKPYVTSNYVVLDAGECNFSSFAVNLTPEEILGRCQVCATPSNCEVSGWGAWSPCPNGTRTRTRTITNPEMNGGTACPSLTETGSCTPPSNGGGTPDIIPCADANRNTAADGSCDTDCLTGYEFDATNNCVAVSVNGGNGGTGNGNGNGNGNGGNGEEEEEGTNWLLVGGGGAVVVALIAAMVLAPKPPTI